VVLKTIWLGEANVCDLSAFWIVTPWLLSLAVLAALIWAYGPRKGQWRSAALWGTRRPIRDCCGAEPKLIQINSGLRRVA